MITNYWRNTVSVIVAAFIFTAGLAQTSFDGDRLPAQLGKHADGPDIAALEAAYHCEMANSNHYVSKEGLELMMLDGSLNQIQLYSNSTVYGEFKGQLPHLLKFGMTLSQVKVLLGRPTVNYSSSGYAEFEKDGFVFACGFTAGKLDELTLSRK